MRVLCVCEQGNCRSVCLARVLKENGGHDAVAVGARSAGKELQLILGCWADRIVLVQKDLGPGMTYLFIDKVRVFDVGPDVWNDPQSPDLEARFIHLLHTKGLE